MWALCSAALSVRCSAPAWVPGLESARSTAAMPRVSISPSTFITPMAEGIFLCPRTLVGLLVGGRVGVLVGPGVGVVVGSCVGPFVGTFVVG